METLLEMLDISAHDDLRKRIDLIERDLNAMAHQRSQVGELPETDLDSTFEIAFKRLEAANRAWGITNKLKNPEDRRMNRKRIAGNLNILRSLVGRLEAALSSDNKSSAGIREDVEKKGAVKSGIKAGLVKAVKAERVTSKEVKKNPFNKNKKIREDVEKRSVGKNGINKNLVKAVKDNEIASHEVKKNPFGKKKANKGFKSKQQ